MARAARTIFGHTPVVVSSYAEPALGASRRIGQRVILDRPAEEVARLFDEARKRGVEVDIIDLSDDDPSKIVPFAPERPRDMIVVNGAHSDHEALAFDLRRRGQIYEDIAAAMGCDVQTVKTYVQRARMKNKGDSLLEEALQLSERLG